MDKVAALGRSDWDPAVKWFPETSEYAGLHNAFPSFSPERDACTPSSGVWRLSLKPRRIGSMALKRDTRKFLSYVT